MNRNDDHSLDVCLVLEGTYPYISGGVSTWVHQAITQMPDLNFGIHFLGAEKDTISDPKYDIPSNVKVIKKVFLFDTPEIDSFLKRTSKQEAYQLDSALSLMYEAIVGDPELRNPSIFKAIELLLELSTKHSFESIWRHPLTWNYLKKLYQNGFSSESFEAFFWNTKFLIKPIWNLLSSFSQIPKARLYHSVCTGYAGFLTAIASRTYSRPYLLSEHGIYVRERVTDLLRNEWTSNLDPDFSRHPTGINPLRQKWINYFQSLSQIAYDSADSIISLFEKNARLQIEFGADPEKIKIIPNGIQPDRFHSIMIEREKLRSKQPDRKNIGFLGRIVSIKDVKTLIRAARLTCDVIPDAQFLLIGPTDEDEDYANACRTLIADLNLSSNVQLPGRQTLDQALPLFDIMVLSSISEGLPFAILESFAAGIPVVSTDVGACKELVYGRNSVPGEEAGIIVRVADASDLSQALIKTIQDKSLQQRFSETGKKRVLESYLEDDVMRQYREIYLNLGCSTLTT